MARTGPKPRTARVTARRAAVPTGWVPPSHLDAVAKAAWIHVVGLLARAGNLDRTDPTLVETYAINVSLLRGAREAIGEGGLIIKDRFDADQVHPAVAIVNSTTMRIKAIVNDLGLCPASSKNAAGKADASPQTGKWAGYFDVVG